MFMSTRFLQRFGAFGFLVVVGTSAPSDTTRRVYGYGYGGVLPVPPAVDVDDAGIQLPDILGQRRATLRSEKGRVLYANERVSTPAGSDAHATSSSRAKRPCSQLVQTRAAGAPDS